MPVSTRRSSPSVVTASASASAPAPAPTSAAPAHTPQLKWFLISAWSSYDSSSMSLSSWAREEARRFHHDVNKEMKFAEVYKTLMEFGTSMTSDHSASKSLKGDSALVSLFVADGEMTEAEQRLGRSKLNSFLYREYCHWWSAFVVEAKEDTQRDAPSASDRFSYHCARMMSRKTGLRDDLIAPVVAAWLIEKANA